MSTSLFQKMLRQKRRNDSIIHRKAKNMIVSVILAGTKGSSCAAGSGYGPADLAHQRSLMAKAWKLRGIRRRNHANSINIVGIRSGSAKKEEEEEEGSSPPAIVDKDNPSWPGRRVVSSKKKKKELGEVYELCKKRILLGNKCKTMNPSGELRYDSNGVLIAEDYIS
ncbi:hypothetical protein Dimus_012088 [Dionaea muscipula]